MRAWVAQLLVFGTSAAVLVLEILAGRIVAPYVGVTLETFTSIVGVVLAAVACGAWTGGRLADRAAPRTLLGPMIVGGGASALAVPIIADGLGPSLQAGGPLASVTLAAAAFFLPAFLLSTVTPIVTKLRLNSLDETGSVVGSLSAIGTTGALTGTFATGFFFIAALPTRPLVIGLGLALICAGLPLLRRDLSHGTSLGGLGLLVAASVGLGAVNSPCQQQTEYFCAVVRVDPERSTGRVLRLDTLTHSYVDLEDPAYLGLRYSRVMADIISMLPEGPLNGVYIGGGGFTLPRYVRAVRPASRATVLEIDGALVQLAERELGLVASADLQVVVQDARLALPTVQAGSADLVIGDAFGGLSVPWHLTTREFVADVDNALAPSGMYVLNVIDYPPAGFVRAEVATLFEVFEHVAVIAPLRHLLGNSGGNFVLVASHRPLGWDRLQRQLDRRTEREVVWWNERAREFAAAAQPLRDDFAPVDQLLSHR